MERNSQRVHAWNQRKKRIPYRQNSSSRSQTADLKYNKHPWMQKLGLEGTREFPSSYTYIFSATIFSLQWSMENEWRAQLWSAYFSTCQSKLDAEDSWQHTRAGLHFKSRSDAQLKHYFKKAAEFPLHRCCCIYCIHILYKCGSVVKNLPANAGDSSLIPGKGRCPGGGNGNPLQYSCLENPMDRGAWWATVHGVKELDMT